MLDEAAQCLETNIREGVRDPRVYQRLAGFYRRQGRHELADEVLVEARRLAERMARPPSPARGARGRLDRGGRAPGAPHAPTTCTAEPPRRPRRSCPATPPPRPARCRPATPASLSWTASGRGAASRRSIGRSTAADVEAPVVGRGGSRRRCSSC